MPAFSSPYVNRYQTLSDNFFAKLEPGALFDIIFIDGDHTHPQVFRDITNALVVLAPNGTIVCHDCNPETEARQVGKSKYYNLI